jgi:hypothetical protein
MLDLEKNRLTKERSIISTTLRYIGIITEFPLEGVGN